MNSNEHIDYCIMRCAIQTSSSYWLLAITSFGRKIVGYCLLPLALWLLPFAYSFAQPKTDCVCSGSTAGGAKIYAGLGGDFHLMNFENDEQKTSLSTMGANIHVGMNLNKNFSLQLGIQKYGLSSEMEIEKFVYTSRYSYLDLSLYGVYRFIKRGSRFIPYFQGGYTLNSTLFKETRTTNATLEENGFAPHASYAHLGFGTLFILANQFTIFAETGLHLQLKDVFTGTYTSDVYKMKYGISVGVNYHF